MGGSAHRSPHLRPGGRARHGRGVRASADRAGPEPRRPLRHRRRRRGRPARARVRRARLDRLDARVQLPLPAADPHVRARGIRELDRARRLHRHRCRRERAGDAISAAGATGGRGGDAPPERRCEDGDSPRGQPRPALAADGNPRGERGPLDARAHRCRPGRALRVDPDRGPATRAPRRQPARPLAPRGRPGASPARGLAGRSARRARARAARGGGNARHCRRRW